MHLSSQSSPQHYLTILLKDTTYVHHLTAPTTFTLQPSSYPSTHLCSASDAGVTAPGGGEIFCAELLLPAPRLSLLALVFLAFLSVLSESLSAFSAPFLPPLPVENKYHYSSSIYHYSILTKHLYINAETLISEFCVYKALC